MNTTASVTRRRLLACGGALALFRAASALAAPGLIVRGNRLYLPVLFNARPVIALLDSAAESSIVDTGFARAMGLRPQKNVHAKGSGGDTEAALIDGITILALGVKLGPLTIAQADLSDIGRRLIGAQLPLILGRELFDVTRLFIDIPNGHIESRSRNDRPIGMRLALQTLRGIETFPAAFENRPPVQAAFDVGNANEVLVGAACAKRAGVLSDGRSIIEKRGGGLGGERLRKTFLLKSLQVAGRTFRNVPAAVDETDSATDLNIGVPILKHFRITSDFSQHLLWLDAAA